VADFKFYDQCSGQSFEVAPAVRECIGKSLSTWRYAVLSLCPGGARRAVDLVYLTSPASTANVGARGEQKRCGA
jgi:hypothetical protein